MKIYTTKKRWKWLLFASATLIFGFFFIYSNNIIKNIAAEERKKIAVWADAITYKAEIVTHTDAFFDNIRIEEGKRASILAQAMEKVNESSFDEDINFYINIITSNSTIPTIVTTPDGEINCAVNVDSKIHNYKNIKELGEEKLLYDSIITYYYKNEYNIIYYKESQIYSDLKVMIDNLVQSFFQEVVINEASVPVIITDSSMQHVITCGNVDEKKISEPTQCADLIKSMQAENNPIMIELPQHGKCYVLYEESSILKKLRYFPFIQMFIIAAFAIIAYLIFSVSRRSEQNQVWVGMSKETAHQLGTPISSLLAWNELLKDMDVDPNITYEMEKDLNRLETIAQRFSKIGSIPEMKPENIVAVIDEFVLYLQSRISSKVTISINHNGIENLKIPINKYLFEWVIENLCKNSVDAMEGKGVILIELFEENALLHIDITDTGKGISSKNVKNIFNPGYTSKQRGWGLGLTLAKRIIKEYHKGKLFVKSTALEHGTTMRITLRKNL